MARESTGVSWQPVWHLLAGHVEWLLVTARHLQTVLGRQTAGKDAEWIAPLRQYGVLRGSVVPAPAVRQWRDFTRHRTQLTGQRPSGVHRLHQVLEAANVQWASVRRAILGVSGLRMWRALGAGETDAEVRRQRGAPKRRAAPAAWHESLHGQLPAPHRFMREGWLAQGAFLDTPMARLEACLEEQRRPFEAQIRRLDTLDGMDRVGAPRVLAELGPDMAPCPDADPLSSGAGRRPGHDERAGKRRSGQTAKGHTWRRRTLTQAAWAAPRHKGGALSAQSRRLASRRGRNRAIVAGGHTILVAAYDIVHDEVAYPDLGSDHCDRRRRERTVSHVVRRLQRWGYHGALEAIAPEAA